MAALTAEIFPTSVRAAVAGWTVAAGVVGSVAGLMGFGALADAQGDFGGATVLFVPATAGAVLFHYLPETKDRELEDWQED